MIKKIKKQDSSDYRIKVVRATKEEAAKKIQEYMDLGYTLEGITSGGIEETDEGEQEYLLLAFKISLEEIKKRAPERKKRLEEELINSIPSGATGNIFANPYDVYPNPADEEEIREYKEGSPVRIGISENGRLVIKVNSLEIDLIDIVEWAYNNVPGMMSMINTDYCDD